jgi:hypothetical protein
MLTCIENNFNSHFIGNPVKPLKKKKLGTKKVDT